MTMTLGVDRHTHSETRGRRIVKQDITMDIRMHTVNATLSTYRYAYRLRPCTHDLYEYTLYEYTHDLHQYTQGVYEYTYNLTLGS